MTAGGDERETAERGRTFCSSSRPAVSESSADGVSGKVKLPLLYHGILKDLFALSGRTKSISSHPRVKSTTRIYYYHSLIVKDNLQEVDLSIPPSL
jgi:hypothetical protein